MQQIHIQQAKICKRLLTFVLQNSWTAFQLFPKQKKLYLYFMNSRTSTLRLAFYREKKLLQETIDFYDDNI